MKRAGVQLLLWSITFLACIQFVIGQDYEPGKRLEYKTRAIGNSWIGPVGKHMQNHITNIRVFDDGTVRTSSPWDEGGNRCAEYKDGAFVRKAACDANSKVAVDLNGNTWTIMNYYGRFLDISANHGGPNATDRWRIDPVPTGDDAPYIKSSDGREIRTIADPSAIGINKVTGELLVADNSEAQNIKIFNISGEPELVGTFGIEGGIYSGPNPGAKDDPLKFNGITGVGTDAQGNIYVSCDGFPGSQAEGGGSDLRAFNPDGTLRWRMVGLMFVRAATVDPISGGSDIFCTFTQYRVDYSVEPGHNMVDWNDVALTIDPFKYPDDPRLVGAVNTPLAIVNVNGNKYMFSTDMYNEPLFVHRFDGHIAVPVAVITAGYGWNGDEVIKFRWKHNRGRPNIPRWIWVDHNGDGLAQAEEFELFELGGPAERNFVRAISIDQEANILLAGDHGYWLLPTNGFDERGNPQYSAQSIQRIEGTGYNPRAMKWLDEIDVMVAGDGSHSHMSRVMVYDNWSDPDKRTRRYTLNMPPPSSGFDPVGGAFNIAADKGYLYVSYSVRSGPNTGKEGEVLVYRLSDGAYMGYITPGPEVGSYSGWIDMRQATYAYARPNGERLITVEEDGVGKVLIYEWCPPGENCDFECSQNVDSVSVNPSGIILDGLQSAKLQAEVHPDTVCFTRVFWISADESIAVVKSSGKVTSTGVGTTWIKAISEQQTGVTDSCMVTVNYVAVTSISLETDSLILALGAEKKLSVDFQPSNAINRKLLWESSDENVVAVDQKGVITALQEGTAMIMVTTEDGGFTDSCFVEVIPVPVTGVRFNPGYAGVWLNDSVKPNLEIFPADAFNQKVYFQILDESIATVDSNGVVMGIIPGKTSLVATTDDGGFTDTCMVHVLQDHELANLDIGAVCGTGSMTVSENGRYTMRANGADIWNRADEFHFAYQKHAGDFMMIARVRSMTHTDGWAKAGVMFRENLLPGSPFVMMVITPANGSSFQRRPVADQECDHTTPGDGFMAPSWVKLVREGNTFRGYRSKDGKTWALVGTLELELPQLLHAGLCLTAHNSSCAINQSVFDYVFISDDINAEFIAPDNDATLSDLRIDGITLEDFSPSKLEYNHSLPSGTEQIPLVEAATSHEKADIDIVQAELVPGVATIVVTAEDSFTKATYKVNFSFATAVNVFDNDIIVLYPNPAGNFINLMMPHDLDYDFAIRIFDVSGRLKLSETTSSGFRANSLMINVSNLSEGVYFLEIGNEKKVSTKFIIKR
jgi:uncharacterized protein YjdB